MALRIRCRNIVNGAIREALLPDQYSDDEGPQRLRTLLATLLENRPGWTARGPIDVNEPYPRWDLYDRDALWTASYQLVTAGRDPA